MIVVISEQSVAFRIPQVPVLKDLSEANGAPQGQIGMAVNGAAIFGPYNSGCCDATFGEIQTMDYCLGHPANGNYHYHYFAHSVSGYDGCLMSCQHDEVSPIAGVMFDGYPIYGPMQYWSPKEKQIYIDPANCSDCRLRQLNNNNVDVCGGVTVGDGSASDGTDYRYIMTGLFPYSIQCFRGDETRSQRYRNGKWSGYSSNGGCGIGGGAENGCEVFNTDWASANSCTPGNCDYTWPNFADRKRREAAYPDESHYGFTPVPARMRRGTQDPLSGVYFQCDGCTTGTFYA